jgi:short-subunit dehydrogenase involved in D-alanine esterification of teichoic acids
MLHYTRDEIIKYLNIMGGRNACKICDEIFTERKKHIQNIDTGIYDCELFNTIAELAKKIKEDTKKLEVLEQNSNVQDYFKIHNSRNDAFILIGDKIDLLKSSYNN